MFKLNIDTFSSKFDFEFKMWLYSKALAFFYTIFVQTSYNSKKYLKKLKWHHRNKKMISFYFGKIVH